MSEETVRQAVEDIRQGRMVVVVDDEARENEGDLVIAADCITPEAVNFMASKGRGLICVSMEGWRLDELSLHAMADQNTSQYGTAFTVSVDAAGRGVTTGMSASDRSTTIQLLSDDHAKPADFSRPGHVFPLRASVGGVLERPGHTEAAIDLCKLAERAPVGVVCEIVSADGSMARRPELERFAAEHKLTIVTIADLIAMRRAESPVVLAKTPAFSPRNEDRKDHMWQDSAVTVRTGELDASKLRIGIVVSRFNELICKALLQGAIEALVRNGSNEKDITVVWVPGAFEIPMAAKALAQTGNVDGIACLGAVVRGDTAHFEFVARAASEGISAVSLETGIPCTFGVLTTETMEQALDRAGGNHGNKGAEAALTAVEMASVLRSLRHSEASRQTAG